MARRRPATQHGKSRLIQRNENKKSKRRRASTNQNEGLIFEKSSPGKRAFEIARPSMCRRDPAKALGPNHRRAGIEGFPR